jgi:4'-phosphopantetheinyl transferase
MTSFSPVWDSPPADLQLSSQLEIWRASLDPPSLTLSRLYELLSPDERARAERYHFQIDRDRFVAARGILRTLLGRYLRASPNSIEFKYGAYGKPMLDANVRFNVSHSQGLALFAITPRQRVGIDLEFVRDDIAVQDLVARFFSEQERRAFRAIPQKEQQKTFFTFWTRKEAYLKARGLSISLLQDENVGAKDDAEWTVTELTPADGYAAAVATEVGVTQVNYWQWQD